MRFRRRLPKRMIYALCGQDKEVGGVNRSDHRVEAAALKENGDVNPANGEGKKAALKEKMNKSSSPSRDFAAFDFDDKNPVCNPVREA